jgi:hypothetical protein
LETRFKRGLLGAISFIFIYFISTYFSSEAFDWYFCLLFSITWFLVTSSKWWAEMLIEYSTKTKRKNSSKNSKNT